MSSTILTSIGFVIIPIVLVATLFGYYKKESNLPWDWPIIRVAPSLLANLHRIHDYFAEILQCSGGTFALQPQSCWFALGIWLTSDPANVHHMMSTSFSIYPKGIEWRKRFDLFRNSLFNVDFGKHYRTAIRSFLNDQRFHKLVPTIFEDSMAKQLLPDLEHASKQHVPVALQHLLDKHIYYISCRILTGCDSILLNSHAQLFSKALADACEAIFSRFLLPKSVWKVKKLLGIGKEKRLNEAWVTLGRLISEYISINQEKEALGTLSALQHFIIPPTYSNEATRNNALGFLFAVHDTAATALSWFFWILSKHPMIQKRIREEIQTFLPKGEEAKWFGAKGLNKMVYLHAAVCETFRLYPPVPLEARTPLQEDTLPSGHKVNPKTIVVISTYGMGRMSSIWGEDCHEFKPERWITDDGEIKHVPSHKFFSFLAGPRICPGKNLAFTLMKSIIAAILHNYDIQVVENQQIAPRISVRPSSHE